MIDTANLYIPSLTQEECEFIGGYFIGTAKGKRYNESKLMEASLRSNLNDEKFALCRENITVTKCGK